MTEEDLIAEDLERLGAVEHRFAGAADERHALELVRARLGDEARTEGFVGHPLPLLVLGLHGLFLCFGGLVGLFYTKTGLLICLLVTPSLIGEGTGRLGLLRAWLPKVPSYNLVVPPAVPGQLGTLVISTPLDIPRWRAPRLRRTIRPLQGVLVSAALLCVLLVLSLLDPWTDALRWIYVAALVVAAVAASFVFVSRREPRGVSSEASGLAVTLALARRLKAQPLEGVATWFVFTGCGRAHQDGMRAFLRLRGEQLQKPVLVLSLVDVGRPATAAVVTEGPLVPQHHRPTGPALVERMRWAGVRVPEVDRADPTDARMAMILGYRAMAFAGGDGLPTPATCRRAADLVETVARWYRDDVSRLADERARMAPLTQTLHDGVTPDGASERP
jgi:hypothetical protein